MRKTDFGSWLSFQSLNRFPLSKNVFTGVSQFKVYGIFSAFGGNISVNSGAVGIAPFLASQPLSEEDQ